MMKKIINKRGNLVAVVSDKLSDKDIKKLMGDVTILKIDQKKVDKLKEMIKGIVRRK